MQANLGAAASHRLTSLVDGVLLEVRRVGAAAVVRDVNPSLLLLHRDAQAAGGLQGPEDDRDCYGGPGEDGDDPDDVGAKETAILTVESAAGARQSIDFRQVLGLCHETGVEHTPCPSEAVNGRGLKGVVNAELQQQLGREDVHEGAHEAADEGGPRLDDGARGSDGDEARQQAIAHADEVPDAVKEVLDDEGPEHDEGRGVAGHGQSLPVRVEATQAGTTEGGTDEPGETADHVHDAGTCEVNHTSTE